MLANQLLIQNRDQILKIASDYGAYNVRVFGSVARGEETPQSDIDFLVDLQPGRSLLDLGGLLYDLQELLNTEVDVITEKGLQPRIKKKILKEAVAI